MIYVSFVWSLNEKLHCQMENILNFQSFQDILREKTNHIEQLMKERETDREEMSAQSILFQKTIHMVII